MQCAYFSASRCHSCTRLETPYPQQLQLKQERVEQALDAWSPAWLAPHGSEEACFRNKAKMVVGGRTGRVTLGILDRQQAGVDLTGCELHERPLLDALPVLSSWINATGLTPYSVPQRQGELKHVIATVSPDGELSLRFVLRSEGQLGRLRRALEHLTRLIPGIRAVSVNLQPAHKAVLEGDSEIALLGERLPMRLGAVALQLGYRSFFQTNTQVTRGLYARASEWVTDDAPRSVWDLYCGVGGFALHAAAAAQQAGLADLDIVGVEVSEDAIAGAQLAAQQAGVRARFVAADATEMPARGEQLPDLVIVNPPRRGITTLAPWLESTGVQRVLYSSCNPATLRRDIEAMPSLRPVRAQLFDMFPHTDHAEVLVELVRD